LKLPQTLNDIADRLAASGLMSVGEIASLLADISEDRPTTPQQFVALLTQRGALTSYQAECVLAGHVETLVLDNYLVLDKLGQGGMGLVMKARHRRMDRLVAMKVLSPEVVRSSTAIERFQREVRAIAKLSHPNIVTAFDANEHHGTHFLVMEYVNGRTLSEMVKQHGPLSIPLAIECIHQAALGLEYAHQQGIVHRDIKPGNLMLSEASPGNQFVVKILDMGLAHMNSSPGATTNRELTTTGAVLGTIDYMAPEQALDTKLADARSDIYSLGCSLFGLLAGRPLYEGDTAMRRILAHRDAPIPSLSHELNGTNGKSNGVDAATLEHLDQVFRKMVAKQPEDRWQTMEEVVRAFAALRTLPGIESVEPWFGMSSRFAASGSSTSALHGPREELSYSSMPPTTIVKSGAAADTSRKKRRTKSLQIGIVLALVMLILGYFSWPKPDRLADTHDTTQSEPQDIAPSKPTIPPPAIAPFGAEQARAHQEAWAKFLGTTVETKIGIGMSFVLLPPGEFLMGSTDEQIQAALGWVAANEPIVDQRTKSALAGSEGPQHRVVLTKPAWIGTTEVTIGQFKKFVEATQYVTQAEKLGDGNSISTEEVTNPNKRNLLNWRAPGYQVTDNWPVTQITWNDALAFCNWLSSREQLSPCYQVDAQGNWTFLEDTNGFRLPTEAEWEYACRAGTTTQYWFGDDAKLLEENGWYDQNAGDSARPVGLKRPNAFGLFDTAVNVWEWCRDWRDAKWYANSPLNDPHGPDLGKYRTIRGGVWDFTASNCRSAYRTSRLPEARHYNVGLRVIRTFDEPDRSKADDPPTLDDVSKSNEKPAGPAPPAAMAPFESQQAKDHQTAWASYLGTKVETINSAGMPMILIPPGEFLMGSTNAQVQPEVDGAANTDANKIGRKEVEQPQHRVAITKPFRIGATEVTVGQFEKFVAATAYKTEAEVAKAAIKPPPSTGGQKPLAMPPIVTYLSTSYPVADDLPVSVVSWNEAIAFCKWLSDTEKATYRLPTEAEWEYACRAGSTSVYSYGDGIAQLPQHAWCQSNSRAKAHRVATKLPNPFGLYDMHGNLYEWCQDWYDPKAYEKSVLKDLTGPLTGSNRVLRGGNWYNQAFNAESSYRSRLAPSERHDVLGFRCVRVLDAPLEASPPSQAANPPTQDHDRRIAEWVIRKGGNVQLNGQSQDFASIAELPKENFKATSISFLATHSELDDDGLKHLHGADNLKRLVLYDQVGVTDAGIAQLAGISCLKHLDLRDIRMTDKGIQHFADMKQLKTLALMGPQFTDSGVAHLAECSRLRTLQLRLPQMTNKGLEQLKSLTKGLACLSIGGSQVTNDGLEVLTESEQLEQLGLDALKISDDGLKHLERLKGLVVLNLSETPISDAGLIHLRELTNLSDLALIGTQVTEAGVADLKDALPKCVIRFQ
jgi:formylglycine-generating enzyme required for sulfatase activity/serine/threonine protein kinase